MYLLEKAQAEVPDTLSPRRIRQLRIREQGYDPIAIENRVGWVIGHIEDPRPFKVGALLSDFDPIKWSLIIFVLAWASTILTVIYSMTALVINLGAGFFELGFRLPSGLGVMMALLAISLIHTMFCVVLPELVSSINKANRAALKQAGMNWDSPILRVKIPTANREAYQQARGGGLFTQFRVWAPEKAFLSPRPIDPIIFGITKDGETYLITQWG